MERSNPLKVERRSGIFGRPNPTVGIVGCGRFGKLAAKFIARKTNVLVYDKRKASSGSDSIKRASLREVASRQIVILAVPVSALQDTLHAIKPFLSDKKISSRHSTLLIDVCAVKAKPVQWMKKILPGNVQILATHPLFGPDSAGNSLKGHCIYVSPVRISKETLHRVTVALQAAGLVVKRITPRQHDKIIAETLFLTQYVGRLVSAARLLPRMNVTTSYNDLMKIVKIADNDTRELFRDMMVYNPYAKSVVRKLLRAQRIVLRDLEKR